MGDDVWAIYQTDEVPAWVEALRCSDPEAAEKVEAAVDVLSEYGPTLGRPLVDTLVASTISNLKEPRPRQTTIRVLFAFDPWRSAILLIAGDKARQWKTWYERAIPQAEELYAVYLKERGNSMSSFSKWDRDAYRSRVGEEEASRRRGAVMAEQWGHQLAEQRKRLGFTQAGLAEIMGVTPGRVSQIERGEVATVDALAVYVAALGGSLELIADIGGHLLKLPARPAA